MPSGDGSQEEFVQLTDLEVGSSRAGPWPTWEVHFRGARPGSALLRERLVVRIVEDATQTILDDDAGMSMEVRYDTQAKDRETWLARWTPRGAHCSKVARFVVGATSPAISKPFVVRCSGLVPGRRGEAPSGPAPGGAP